MGKKVTLKVVKRRTGFTVGNEYPAVLVAEGENLVKAFPKLAAVYGKGADDVAGYETVAVLDESGHPCDFFVSDYNDWFEVL
ncbi:hypothetical protein aldrigsur_34 [Escherichia phage aldrigsur]|nr:hypothetical protein aldrigsur_34 [Escherichia phage aldrigsur]